ncbi:MAG: ParB N-terminal domain-containing protein [Leptolyngbyaceae cyanobacterium RU_5_1]|nr:ParB N-terminal domain-containing protein [Leptolyngbyaceae cyanobacterium RU_5_1]
MADLSKIIQAVQAQRGDAAESIDVRDFTLPLNAIHDRLEGDTRPLNTTHVDKLMESIATLGLIEPIVVDTQNRLLAGGHRRAAIAKLRDQKPEIFEHQFPKGAVPVRVMPFDSEEHPDLALAVETTENDQRKNYTKAEVLAIAEKLRSAGYRDSSGRPKKGEKRLKPALMVIFGTSLRTVERYLAEDEKTPPGGGVSSEVSPAQIYKQSLRKLKQCQTLNPTTSKERDLAKKLPDVIQLLEEILQDSDVK